MDGGSQSCGKCSLCGHWGDHKNMVIDTKEIKTNRGKFIKLNQTVNCSDFGIYAAKCRICKDFYVGQTGNSFSKRWNGHRKIWKETILETKSHDYENEKILKDDQALTNHYLKTHKDIIKTRKPKLAEAYEVIFVEAPKRKEDLDLAESCWLAKLEAKINIAKTVLPRYR